MGTHKISLTLCAMISLFSLGTNCGHLGVGRNSRFEALRVELELTVYGTINIHQHINSNVTILCYYWHKGFLPGP